MSNTSASEAGSGGAARGSHTTRRPFARSPSESSVSSFTSSLTLSSSITTSSLSQSLPSPPLNDSPWLNFLEKCEQVDWPPWQQDGNLLPVTWEQHHRSVTWDSVTSPEIGLEAAWAIILQRYCDSDTVCFRSLLDTNPHAADGPAASFRRFHFTDNTTVQDVFNAAEKQRSSCFERPALMVEESTSYLRQSGRESLLATVFAGSTPLCDSLVGRLSCGIVVSYERTDHGCTVEIRHTLNTIDHSQGQRLLNQLCYVCTQLVHPNSLIHDLTISSPEDALELSRWNDLCLEPTKSCVHALVSDRASIDPYLPALSSINGTMTFDQVDIQSSQIAHTFRLQGIAKKMIVPILFEKSALAVLAMLGVLKAGAAFAALDPAQPEDRLRQMLNKLGATTIVCSTKCLTKAQTLGDNICCVTEEWCHEQDSTEVMRIAGPVSYPTDSDEPAFILFTSGSTGLPKGIVIHHEAFCSSMNGHGETLRFRRGGRNFQYTAYTSDVSMGEIFTSLTRGACVCIPTEEERLNDIGGAMRRLNVDWAFLTPTVASLVQPDQVPNLRTLVYGGEVASPENIRDWASRLCLINSYGPAETSIWTTAAPGVHPSHKGNNIGPRMGCSVWLVDPDNHHRLAPIGAIGELLAEGPCLARGYLNDPEKTNAAFVDNLAWRAAPSRMYKTGDLARYTSQGEIIFLGRKDTQVKLHAQRIELSDVECHLRTALDGAIPSSELAVELADVDGHGPKLVAFLGIDETQRDRVCAPESSRSTSNLARTRTLASGLWDQLSTKLPRHMIPSYLLMLAFIPMTASAKVNRKALREFAAHCDRDSLCSLRTAQKSSKQPTSPLQLALRALWEKVLGVDRDQIYLDSDFFALGGESILAMRLAQYAREACINLNVSKVFQNPTLRLMAGICHFAEVDSSISLPGYDYEKSHRETVEAAEVLRVCSTTLIDVSPCTPTQAELYYLSKQSHGSLIAHFIFDIPHDGRAEQFMHAWEQTRQNISLLRSVVVELPRAGLRQVVLTKPSQISREQHTSLERYCQRISRSTSNLSAMSQLVVVDDGRYDRLVWSIHHSLCDSWTIRLVLQHVFQAYSGKVSAPTPSFAHYTRYLNDDATVASQDYWKAYLHDSEVSCFPPAAYPKRDVYHATQVVEAEFEMSSDAHAAFTRGTILRAAWALLVSHYCDSADVCFATTVNGRNSSFAGVETMVGPTLNTIPLRIAIEKTKSPHDFLAHVQRDTAATFDHQFIGLSGIQSATGIAFGFQSFFIVQSSEEEDCVGVTDLFRPSAASKPMSLPNALTFECTTPKPGSNSIRVRATFDDEVLERHQLQLMIDNFTAIAQQLCDHRLQCLNDIKVVPDDLANTMQLERPTSLEMEGSIGCIHEYVLKTCIRCPEANAVESWDGTLTYAELNAMSSILANKLQGLGVGPEITVGLQFEKSTWATVAMLSVIKAGGAFVPLEPNHPAEFRTKIVTAANINVVLCSDSQIDSAHRLRVRDVLPITKETCLECPSDDEQIFTSVAPTTAACVLYTSGTTGTPKGIVIEHRQFCSAAFAHANTMHYQPSMRAYQYSNYTFDLSLYDIFTTWFVGGTVCVPSDDERFTDLAASLESWKATWAFLTPSVVKTIKPESVPHLKTLVLAGETIPEFIIDSWGERLELICGYGPTECLVCTVGQLGPRGFGFGCIGLPVACKAWVVSPDDHGKLLPTGAIGELLIEGPIVARGYLNDDERSAKSFVEAPAWRRNMWMPCERMFKTGDLARVTVDGALVLYGRRDNQVKLRGQRLELDEVEHALQQELPLGTAIACDVVMPHPSAEARLTAFIAPTIGRTGVSDTGLLPADSSLEASVLASFQSMQAVLPSFKTPTAYFGVSRIPLTASGKTNRRALRRLVKDLPMSRWQMSFDLCDEPQTNLTEGQILLRDLWSELISIDSSAIQKRTNFFYAGGDSITAMRLTAMVRHRGYTLKLSHAMMHPTLEEMAALIRPLEALTGDEGLHNTDTTGMIDLKVKTRVYEAATSFLALPQTQVSNILPLTQMQEYLVSDASRFRGRFWHQHIFSLPHSVDDEAFLNAWTQVINRHDILRTRIFPVDGTWYQAIVPLACAMVISRSAAEGLSDTKQRHRRLVLQNPTASPQLAAICTDHDTGRSSFLWTCPHWIFDGLSLNIILADLERRLGFFNNQEESKYVPSPPPQFSVVVEQLRRSDPDALDTMDNLSPANENIEGAESNKIVDFSAHVLKQDIRLPQGLPRTYTVSTMLHACCAVSLAAEQGQGRVFEDIVFATTTAGRNLDITGIERIVGPVLNQMPLRIRLVRDEPVTFLLDRVQDQVNVLLSQSPTTKSRRDCERAIPITIHPFDILTRNRAGIILESSDPLAPLHTQGLGIQFTTTSSSQIRAEVAFDGQIWTRQRALTLVSRIDKCLTMLGVGVANLLVGHLTA